MEPSPVDEFLPNPLQRGGLAADPCLARPRSRCDLRQSGLWTKVPSAATTERLRWLDERGIAQPAEFLNRLAEAEVEERPAMLAEALAIPKNTLDQRWCRTRHAKADLDAFWKAKAAWQTPSPRTRWKRSAAGRPIRASFCSVFRRFGKGSPLPRTGSVGSKRQESARGSPF